MDLDGAALFHTAPSLLKSYLLRRLYTVPPSLNPPPTSPNTVSTPAIVGSTKFSFNHRANVLDRDAVMIPSGWDSWGKSSAPPPRPRKEAINRPRRTIPCPAVSHDSPNPDRNPDPESNAPPPATVGKRSVGGLASAPWLAGPFLCSRRTSSPKAGKSLPLIRGTGLRDVLLLVFLFVGWLGLSEHKEYRPIGLILLPHVLRRCWWCTMPYGTRVFATSPATSHPAQPLAPSAITPPALTIDVGLPAPAPAPAPTQVPPEVQAKLDRMEALLAYQEEAYTVLPTSALWAWLVHCEALARVNLVLVFCLFRDLPVVSYVVLKLIESW
ncbi:hypothetical protein L198_06290 [Cryptococcus wingfieldii CBS 7118]|uniref:Uncharacterized protein n=1 Tax=Cryptococcus wingfieldii CBS 7118 TaxID=1295528 RepID=A0A1E3INV8_9TREE|nr:hypothetical protein L198_06290 [Cryptococcus wingfieldii CBS 7118]ODN90272.1 hypothetical protein L198_06290 [Cryptococcus wingfieldii CBS 7118]